MKKVLTFIAGYMTALLPLQAQSYNQLDPDGNLTQRNEYGTSSNFNPNQRDSVKSANKDVPIGVRFWTVDRRFGDVIPAEADTIPHLYQNSIHNTGLYGEYNSIGNNYSARLSRIFIDRPDADEFFFVQPYSFTTKQPDDFLFVNTLSPYTKISYDECGDKQNGEDHIDAKFAVNAGKRFGVGFDLDYHYALGYFSNQSNAHFRSSLFSSYIGDRYQMHLLASLYHRKTTENGGITDDQYITHPESFDDQFSEDEIPTVLSQNWNRNNSQHLFFSHRYNFGFYRKVKMTDEEIKARQFAQKSAQQQKEKEQQKDDDKRPSKRKPDMDATALPSGRPSNAKIMGEEPTLEQPAADSTRIRVESREQMDSLLAVQAQQDSIDATMKKEYVPVTSLIHTLDINNYDRIYQAYASPTDYYANTYYDLNDENQYSNDSIFDRTKYLSIKNTVALALLEGFNKYMKAGMKVFLSHEYRRYKMPDLAGDSTAYYMRKWTDHALNIGGQISKTQGNTLHFNLAAELGVTGCNAGDIAIDFDTDLNFPLLGDTVQLAAKAYFHSTSTSAFQESFHSKHLWWEQSLDKEKRTHIEGLFSYEKTNTRLRVAVDEIQNYTYFGMNYTIDSSFNRTGMTGCFYQESGNINVLTAQLMQTFRLGVINWENVITYQNSSNKEVLPLPTLNVFSNLFLKFKIARVLSIELGACATYFSKYEAPDYLPAISQFGIQQNAESRVKLGGYPFVDVYANMHLKRARFFVAMTHVNAGSGTKMQFLTPHYPMNNRTLRLGVSWNFFN